MAMWQWRLTASGLSVRLNDFLAKLFEIRKIIHIFARFYVEGALSLI